LLQLSGRSKILGRGVQVQVNYCNSMRCYILPGKGSESTLALTVQNMVEALYVYAEAIHTKQGKFSELGNSSISGIIQQTLSCSCQVSRTCSAAPT